MKNQTSDRLKQFIKEQGLTIQEFEQICDLSNGYVNNIRKGVGDEKLEQILEHFPALNKEWLLYGIGDETISDQQKPQSSDGKDSELVKSLKSHIADLQSQVEDLKAQRDYYMQLLGMEPIKKEKTA